MQQIKRLILASKSPRRQQLLEEAGLKFDIYPANINEDEIVSIFPRLLVKKLSYAKAVAVKDKKVDKDAVILSADTVVVYGGKVFGKPENADNAFKMLKELNGHTHTVYTGVTLLIDNKAVTFAVKSKVKFKYMTDAKIKKYIDECKPFDKAGAYGIQDKQIVERFKGSYTNIVGLPMEKLTKVLQNEGVTNGGN